MQDSISIVVGSATFTFAEIKVIITNSFTQNIDRGGIPLIFDKIIAIFVL